MHEHARHEMHGNSLAAHAEGMGDGTLVARAAEILDAFSRLGAMTDRECAIALRYGHKAAVQPRISEMVKAGVLREIGRRLDVVTRKRVRVCALRPPEQMFLLAICDGPAGSGRAA